MSQKGSKLFASVSSAMITFLAMVNMAFAAGPGEKIGSWMQAQAQGIFIAVVAVIGIVLMIARKLMQAIICLVFAGLAAWFIYSPDSVATTMKSIITSFF